MNSEHVLDPLWITKGRSGLDPEYYNYVLLAANKKYREKLVAGDISSFYDIYFHCLNLNNLAIEGSIFEFNMKMRLNDPKLKEIKESLKHLYQLPENVVEIFKNANFLLINLLIDYLDQILDTTEDTKMYFVNPEIHLEKEIFLVLSKVKSPDYSIWKIKFDRRLKFGHSVDFIRTVQFEDSKRSTLSEKIKGIGDKDLKELVPNQNVCFAVYKNDIDQAGLAISLLNSIIFNRAIYKDSKFEPNILNELLEILETEGVLPFTMRSWI